MCCRFSDVATLTVYGRPPRLIFTMSLSDVIAELVLCYYGSPFDEVICNEINSTN